MKQFKRFAALLITVVLLVSTGIMTAFAYTSDPLKGLVADDILTPFRAEIPVGHAGIDDDPVLIEACTLGAWVHQKLGNSVASEIYAKGQNIGNTYEWLFGGDIDNNFDNNFALIYAYYFGMKSEDQRGVDGRTYQILYAMYDDGGASQEFGRLYKDMQEFVTACNNAIRKKGGNAGSSRFERGWVYGDYAADFGNGRAFSIEFGYESGSGNDYIIRSGFHTMETYITLYRTSDNTWVGTSEDCSVFYNGVDQLTVDGIVYQKTRDLPHNAG